MGGVLQTLAVMIIFAVVMYFVTTSVRMERFMVGERCNAQRCNYFDEEMSELKLEQQRLQRQIDRLENTIPGVRSEPLPPYGV